jgi:acetyl esterase/lipase
MTTTASWTRGPSCHSTRSAAGAEVSARRYAGVAHGFLRLHNHLDVAREALGDVAAEAVRPAD